MLFAKLPLAFLLRFTGRAAALRAAIRRLQRWPKSPADERAAREIEAELFFDQALLRAAQRAQGPMLRRWRRGGRLLATLVLCALPSVGAANTDSGGGTDASAPDATLQDVLLQWLKDYVPGSGEDEDPPVQTMDGGGSDPCEGLPECVEP